MIWNICYTASARQDLQDIYDYIADILFELEVAEKQTNRIMDAIDSLEHMPLRYRLYDYEPWHSKGWRVMPVDNYLVFYFPDESQDIVAIIRIMYRGRNIKEHLNKGGKCESEK